MWYHADARVPASVLDRFHLRQQYVGQLDVLAAVAEALYCDPRVENITAFRAARPGFAVVHTAEGWVERSEDKVLGAMAGSAIDLVGKKRPEQPELLKVLDELLDNPVYETGRSLRPLLARNRNRLAAMAAEG